MRADICVGLGGMCAERLVFGEVSIGAHTDLQQVNRIARAMVEEYGMGASTGCWCASTTRRVTGRRCRSAGASASTPR
ncbi:hypothetical protein [Nannocystis pusilla]|uniref:hypothetical protein n=1 Tax=Nannocystis pusilla TaxID=889268 RepID=UPI003B7A654C